MTIRDEDQIRAWTVDYSLRLHPKDAVVTPEQIIADAKKFQRYITDARPANLLKLAKSQSKK